MSDIVLKGRVNLRRMLGSVVLILFTLPIGFLPGRLYFFLFTIIGFIFLYFSLPIKLILNDSSLLIKRAFIEEPKQILIWEDVIETRETEVNEWKGFFNIVSNLFLFGWISLIVFRFKYKKITIIYGEYEEFHVSEYLIKNYETIEKTLADKKQHSSNDHT